MPEVTLRRAIPADAPAIARIHLASWKTTYRGIVPEAALVRLEENLLARTERWRVQLADSASEWTIVADVVGAGSVGFVRGGVARPPHFGFDGELGAIYLIREHQRRGIGRALVRAHVTALREAGHRRMLVWVLTENPARGFYEHFGATRLGTMDWVSEGKLLEVTALGWDDLESLAVSLDATSGRKPFY
jgi:GNAT superfamily N-acetyltransferase